MTRLPQVLARVPRRVWIPGGFLLLWTLGMGTPLLILKVLALLAMPVGWIWILGLFGIPWMRPGWMRRAAFGFWLVFWALGTLPVGNRAVRFLEDPYRDNPLPARPYRAILVLGGGTVPSPTPYFGAQVSGWGDRLVSAARLFHRGASQELWTSGVSITDPAGPRSLAKETREIWQDLGVPPEKIREFAEPRSTQEEIRSLKQELSRGGIPSGEVAVLSSAFHLERVRAHLEAEGLDCPVLPGGFLTREYPLDFLHLTPRAYGYFLTHIFLHEKLGLLKAWRKPRAKD